MSELNSFYHVIKPKPLPIKVLGLLHRVAKKETAAGFRNRARQSKLARVNDTRYDITAMTEQVFQSVSAVSGVPICVLKGLSHDQQTDVER